MFVFEFSDNKMRSSDRRSERRKERQLMLLEINSFDHTMRDLQKKTATLLHHSTINDIARLKKEKQARHRVKQEREQDIREQRQQQEREHLQRVNRHRKQQLEILLAKGLLGKRKRKKCLLKNLMNTLFRKNQIN